MLTWFRELSSISKIAAPVGVIAGAITATAIAWPHVEFGFPAHRGYVVSQVGDVKNATNELLIWKFEDGISRAKRDASGWNIQLQKETNPAQRGLIQSEIDRLLKEQKDNEGRIQRLKGTQ